MIRTVSVLFCDQDHGLGEQTFPRLEDLKESDFIEPRSAVQLRRDAKKAGWTRGKRNDFCDLCSGSDEAN